MAVIGAHLRDSDPLADAIAIGARAGQFFLGDPQSWKPPVPPADPGQVRKDWEAAGIAVYIHAPYIINVASNNNRIRIPSRKILQQQLDGAAAIGARGLVVHGGHVLAAEDPATGIRNWSKAIEQVSRPVPLLIENTAGGDGAMFRSLENIARLWDAIGDAGNVGFCLDTCHANSAGIGLATAVTDLTAITGRIDLVHCNNSRDPFGSGRDRHAGLTTGTIDPGLLVAVVQEAGSPAVCETPGYAEDVSWLQRNLSGA